MRQPVGSGSNGSAAVVTDKPVARLDFNRLAVHLNIPVFWVEDTNNDSKADDSELTTLQFYGQDAPSFDDARKKIAEAAKAPAPDDKRRQLVLQDLDAGRPTLVRNDFSKASDEDKAFVKHMLGIANLDRRSLRHDDGAQGGRQRPAGRYRRATACSAATADRSASAR